MNRTMFYKLCTVFLIIWAVVAVITRTSILYRIEIFLYRTEQEWIGNRILTDCEDLYISESRYAKIYYSGQDHGYVQLMQRTADIYIPLLSRDFAYEGDVETVVVVYAEGESFKNAVGGSENKLPMGAYYGGLLNILSPRLWAPAGEADAKDKFISTGPMIHELTHFIMDQKTGGNCDTWFNEGVALYYEYKYTAYEWRKDLQDKSREIPFEALAKDFRSLDEGQAYRRAFDIVYGIVEKQGEDGLQQIINGLAEGKSFRKALDSVN